ncbi:CRISPR-associated protein Csb2 [Krasilnikovia cinnamomea]|uniref:CRISPR-associated protein Csb2 n=1 Tax=Krasilnikovia cinnamomea TaxID=349313 RepID=A0A4Q7Z873_9ACTN|nr:type I-U CRISPR-associated protein Csb2 [Krasilnikovia cinnamomea]RZU46648.1 CRISPR-associated protein Csb2 [Krasilnikovia cinnamomea]
MAFSISIRLRDGRFDAAVGHRDRGEWPPHPARVFCALVASAVEDADWAALRWLEQAPAPHVLACPVDDTEVTTRSGFVVTNAVKRKSGSTAWPGRTNGERRRVSVIPASDEIGLVWPQTDIDDAVLGRLLRLTRRVPYLGRSTSSVVVTVAAEAPAPRADWVCYRPAPLGTPGSVGLRVPQPGYVDQLRAAHAEGRRAWEVATRTLEYTTSDEEAAQPDAGHSVVAGPFTDLVVFGIDQSVTPIAGADVLTVTQALRAATISRVPDPVPAQVSGHGADGRPHAAFLALPDVGHPYSDGHLLGVGVALPGDLPPDQRRSVLRGLLAGDGLRRLCLPGGRPLAVSYRPDRSRPYGLLPERWNSSGGARAWVTATPVMLDRYPTTQTAEELVAQTLVTAGYPRPEQVDVVTGPATSGAINALRPGSIPKSRSRRPWVHCRIQFPMPVRGPVIAGSLRYLGVGLFIPHQPAGER